MFRPFTLNRINKNGVYAVKGFNNYGICKLTSTNVLKKKINLDILRSALEKEFKNQNYPATLSLTKINNKRIINQIEGILDSEYIKNFFSQIEQTNDCGPVSLLPLQGNIMRNYFSGPQCGKHGWHRDAEKEYKIKYCNKLMETKRYVFGKLSIALQFNNDNGGNIDIIPNSFSPNSYYSRKIKIFKKITSKLLSKNLFKGVNPLNNSEWLCDSFYKLFDPQSLNVKPLEVLCFDPRIEHRGTPHSPVAWNRLKSKNPDLIIKDYNLSNTNHLPFSLNKYIIYFHFGCEDGLVSNLCGRRDLDTYSNEIAILQEQIDNLKLFNEIFPKSKKIFENALKKVDLVMGNY